MNFSHSLLEDALKVLLITTKALFKHFAPSKVWLCITGFPIVTAQGSQLNSKRLSFLIYRREKLDPILFKPFFALIFSYSTGRCQHFRNLLFEKKTLRRKQIGDNEIFLSSSKIKGFEVWHNDLVVYLLPENKK